MSLGPTALILGASGQTGQHLLKELLASPHFSRVSEYGRRVTDIENLNLSSGKEKLEQKVLDFEQLNESGLKDGKWDVVFITYVPSNFCCSSSYVHPFTLFVDLERRRRSQGVLRLSSGLIESESTSRLSLLSYHRLTSQLPRRYVINAAREAHANDKDQRLVYLSAAEANPNSSFLYPKCVLPKISTHRPESFH